MRLLVGDLALSVQCEDKALVSALSRFLGRFRVTDAPSRVRETVWTMRLCGEEEIRTLHASMAADNDWSSQERLPDVPFVRPVHGGYFLSARHGIVALAQNSGSVMALIDASEVAEGSPEQHFAPFSSLLRMYMSLAFPHERGLLVHAASIADGPRAHLFVGRSGAGKSTVCDLSAPRPVLCDEISVLRCGPNGTWRLYPSPFFSNLGRPNPAEKAQPLSRILLLEHAEEDRLESLSAARALPDFMANVMNFLDDSITSERLLQLSLDLFAAHPPERLFFTRSKRFWHLL